LAAATALAVGVAPPVQAEPPDNDEITDAVIVPGVPYTHTVDTSEASVAGGDSPCGAATVWYSFTPETDGGYLFDTRGSDFDTTLALFEGSPGDLTLVECNDDEFGQQSAIGWTLEAGTTYYIEAGTFGGGEVGQIGPGGNLVFNVTTPAVLEVQLTIDPRATIGPQTGTATVSGTVTCNNDVPQVRVYGTLRQRQGLNIARGDFYTETTCSSTPTSWTYTVDAETRAFLPKRAEVTAFAYGCDGLMCDEGTAIRSVKLRR
jgi:hypothetical protein